MLHFMNHRLSSTKTIENIRKIKSVVKEKKLLLMKMNILPGRYLILIVITDY